jgi:excisionase family DNA binding protein
MAFELQVEESLGGGLHRILLERIDESLNLLQEPGEDFDKSVHEARKNCKRIRAVLRLMRYEIGNKPYGRENMVARDISRLLAPMRDSWVIVETLDGLKAQFADQLPADSFDSIRAKLVSQYEVVRERFMADETILPQAIVELEALRKRVAKIELSDDFAAVGKGWQRVYQRGREGMAAAYAKANDPHEFHDWRKRVKYLWHQFEIFDIIWPVYMSEAAAELHKLADYLGDAHDLFVLKETIQEQPDIFADEPNCELLFKLIDQVQAHYEAAARPLGERLYAEQPSAFTVRLGQYWQVWQRYQVNGLPVQTVVLQPPTLLSSTEAAAQLGISVKQLRQKIGRGELPAVKVSGAWVINASDLADYPFPENES